MIKIASNLIKLAKSQTSLTPDKAQTDFANAAMGIRTPEEQKFADPANVQKRMENRDQEIYSGYQSIIEKYPNFLPPRGWSQRHQYGVNPNFWGNSKNVDIQHANYIDKVNFWSWRGENKKKLMEDMKRLIEERREQEKQKLQQIEEINLEQQKEEIWAYNQTRQRLQKDRFNKPYTPIKTYEELNRIRANEYSPGVLLEPAQIAEIERIFKLNPGQWETLDVNSKIDLLNHLKKFPVSPNFGQT